MSQIDNLNDLLFSRIFAGRLKLIGKDIVDSAQNDDRNFFVGYSYIRTNICHKKR